MRSHHTLSLSGAVSLILLIFVSSCISACPEDIPGLTSWKNTKAVPNGGDYTVQANEKLLLDVDFPSAFQRFEVKGILVFSPNQNHEFHAQKFLVKEGGQLWIGSEDCPFNSKVEIVLHGDSNPSNADQFIGNKYIGMTGNTSRLEIHGTPTTRWTHLAATVPAGSSRISLIDAVNWKVNQSIVVASTDYQNIYEELTEARNITAIEDSGKTLVLDVPLKFSHFSDYVGDNVTSFPVRAEVGMISRNIVIRGEIENEAQFGGHLIATGGLMKLSEVEFYKMGQTGIKARYPVHFHLAKYDMSGSYVKNLAIHNNFQRCVTIHGTNNVTVMGVTAWNNKGHCFFIEDGNEEENYFIENLGLTARASDNEGMLPSDRESSIFWITNANNHLIGNSAGDANTGIWYAFPQNPHGNAEGNPLPNLWLPLGIHRDNTAHSCGRGIFVDHGPNANGETSDGSWYYPRDIKGYPYGQGSDIQKYADRVTAMFQNDTLYKCSGNCVWARGDGTFWKDMKYADCAVSHQFAGLDSRVQNAVMVGKSKNIGNFLVKGRGRPYDNIQLPIIGYKFYHAVGPTTLANVHMVDYYLETFNDGTVNEAAAIGTESGFYSAYIGRSRFFNLHLRNVSSPFLVNRGSSSKGDRNANMVDTDGSLTGVCGAQIVSTSNWIRWDGNDTCQFHSEMNAYICPPDYPSLRVLQFIDNTKTNVLASSGSSSTKSIARLYPLYGKRQNIAEMQGDPTGYGNLNLDPDLYDYGRNYIALVPQNADYYLEYPLGSPRDLSLGVSYSPVGDFANIALPYPPGTTFSVFPQYANDRPMSPATSREGLSPYEYYWDNTAGLLWVQIASRQDEWLWAPRTNPFGPFYNQEPFYNVIASCPNGDCRWTVDPSNIAGSIDLNPPQWQRCKETILGGHTQFSESSNTYSVFSNGQMSSNWTGSQWDGAVFAVNQTTPNPLNNLGSITIDSSGNKAFFSRKDNANTVLDPKQFTHIKLTLRWTKDFELVQRPGIWFYGTGKNPWDTGLTERIEMNSPHFMEHPPVNSTWKEVYVPLKELRLYNEGNIASFAIVSMYPNRPLRLEVAEILFVNVSTSIKKYENKAQLCYGPNNCDIEERGFESQVYFSSSSLSPESEGSESLSGQDGTTKNAVAPNGVGMIVPQLLVLVGLMILFV